MSAPAEPTYLLNDHPARIAEDELMKSCKIRFGRASGPGGQHRNKVETAVRIEHLPSGIEAAATETRSQKDNRKKALFRLRIRLATRISVKNAASLSPSDLWRKRCQNQKLVCNPEHEDAPALLAELWGVLSSADFDLAAAAQQLDCTSSQIVKFLGQISEARERIQEERRNRSLAPLKFRS
ncbi:MAG TPA: peptide chain release factor-like protein [Planctomycetaceae bacterium]|nr:peptide chain release factor-like protein [Planctomycetaceae bacterium]